jgi:IS30 family transposase
LQERLTRTVIVQKIYSKQPQRINVVLVEIIQEFGVEHFKTITTDNGVEFYYLYKIETPLNFLTYYARPYRSGDKGSVENVNSIIRRHFPKGTNFNLVSDQKVR